MATPAADPLPEPDHEYGYSEALLEGVLCEHMVRFREYMMTKTYAISADGPVYYSHDVRRFVDYYVMRTARPLTEADIRALFDNWQSQEKDTDLHDRD
ncbi:hypothetical protein [Microbacterium galbinum]|uniref:Core-binding (CB) domain-containing protein n=1 Tax=Microbacterium galbinum TaxID=2851646 RepID=A0ABY4IST5_9MICO|nr:hypothetical protein [Microbacterium galbinum]UPL15704.1 hypothetical protein KV396_14980 [Microbacterium galbinum]